MRRRKNTLQTQWQTDGKPAGAESSEGFDGQVSELAKPSLKRGSSSQLKLHRLTLRKLRQRNSRRSRLRRWKSCFACSVVNSLLQAVPKLVVIVTSIELLLLTVPLAIGFVVGPVALGISEIWSIVSTISMIVTIQQDHQKLCSIVRSA